MTPSEFGLLLISIVMSVGGQFFLKAGANKLGGVHAGNVIQHILSIVTIPELLTGLTCYGLGAITYILLLTRVKLSIAAPSAASIYVFVVLLDRFVFGESIPLSRWVGLGLIVCGVILVAFKN